MREMLERVAAGELTPEQAEGMLAGQGFTDLGFAKVDTQRAARTGAGEVVYGAGKTAEQIAKICRALAAAGQPCVLVTRLDAEKAREVERLLAQADGEEAVGAFAAPCAVAPGGSPLASANQSGEGAGAAIGVEAERAEARLSSKGEAPAGLAFEYRPIPKLGIYGAIPAPARASYVAVACAGTSDLYCAEEAAVTAEVLGSRVVRLYDVGVAGIHRLLAHADDLAGASAIVAVAGMEGALASVVGGMAKCPVIAVPTSVGYGASFNGLAALLAMLNSCASGVSVVNIDNGFGAGYQAHMIESACGVAREERGGAMNTLHWNLSENATRAQLLGDTLLQLPEGAREQLEQAAAAAGVPERHHHNIGEVLATIDTLAVSDRVKADLRAVYTILAEAEAAAHGCAVGETHFHEVGDGARIRNTLLLCLAIEQANPQRIVATPAQTGEGTVMCAHGELAIPAPATAAIIARGIPTATRKLPGERMTPTSAAIILHFVDEFAGE